MEKYDCPLSNEDINKVKNLQNTSNSLINMQEDIQSLKEDMKEIKDALLGDSFNPGFKQRIQKVEIDTTHNTQKISKLYTYFAAIVSVLGVVSLAIGLLTKLNVI